MSRTFLRKVTIATLCAAALIGIVVPLGLYWLGLSNIVGRPIPPTKTNNVAADTELLKQTFRSEAPVKVCVLNPWTYVGMRFKNGVIQDSGSHAVWLIVSKYDGTHLKSSGMASWHLTGTALMIWLSRNWTPDEIVTAAAAIVRSKFPPYNSSGLVEVGSLHSLPKGLSTLLGAHWKCCGMVDVGEDFYPTDVVGGPDKRFLLAGVSKESALVAYEWGNGWERGIDAAAYVFSGADWHLIARWHLDFKPSSLSQLRDATNKLPREIVQSHYFDGEPFFVKSDK